MKARRPIRYMKRRVDESTPVEHVAHIEPVTVETEIIRTPHEFLRQCASQVRQIHGTTSRSSGSLDITNAVARAFPAQTDALRAAARTLRPR
jgi:hypothetical protein